MALSNETKGITLRFGAEGQELNNFLSEMTERARMSQTALSGINRLLRELDRSGELTGDVFSKTINRQLEECDKKIEQANKQIEGFGQAIKHLQDKEKNGLISDKEIKDLAELQKRLDYATADLRKYQRIRDNLEGSKLDGGFNKMSAHSQKLSNELKKVNAELNKTKMVGVKSIDALAKKEEILTQLTRETSRHHKELLSKMEQIKKMQPYREKQADLDKLSKAIKECDERSSRFNTQLMQTKAKIADVNTSADRTKNTLSTLGKAFDSGKSKGGAFASMVGNVAANALRDLAYQAIAAAKEVYNVGAGFETSQSKVRALSGATEADMAAIEGKARELGQSTKFTATEVSDAMSYMALAGWDTNEMLAGVDGTLSLAAASMMDIDDATSIVTSNLKAFGLEATDTSHFVDAMATAQANSNTTTEQLSEAYKHAAATAHSYGYTMEDTTAVLMAMANAGIRGEEAGTGLRTLMIRLATDTSKCNQALSEYGVSVYDEQGNLRNFIDIIYDTAAAMEGMSDKERAVASKKISGVFQYTKLQTVLAGVSKTAQESGRSIKDFANMLYDCDGAAKNMADTMIDNVEGSATIAMSALQETTLKMFDGFSGNLKGLFDDIPRLLSEISGSATDFGGIVDGIIFDFRRFVNGELPNMVNGIADFSKVAIPFLESAITNLPQLATGLFTVSVAATALSSALKLAVAASSGMAATFGPAGWIMLVVGVIAAIVGGFATFNATIGATSRNLKATDSEFASLSDSIDGTALSLKNMAYEQAQTFKKAADSSRDIAEQYGKYQEAFDTLRTMVDVNGKIKEGYEDQAASLVDYLNQANLELSIQDGVVQDWKDKNEQADSLIEKQRVINELQSFSQAAADAKNNTYEYQEKYGSIKGDIAELEQLIKQKEDAIATLREGYDNKSAIEQVSVNKQVDAINKEIEQLNQKLSEANSAKDLAAKIYQNAKTVSDAYDSAQKLLYDGKAGEAEEQLAKARQMSSQLEYLTSDSVSTLNDYYAELQRSVQNVINAQELSGGDVDPNSVNILVERLKNLFEGGYDVDQYLSQLKTETREKVKKALEDALRIDGLLGEWNSGGGNGAHAMTSDPFASGIASLENQFKNDLNSAGFDSAARDLGANITRGLSEGIIDQAAVDLVLEYARRVTNRTIEEMRAAADVHSPSKKSMKIGVGITDGLSVGMEKSADNLYKTAQSVTNRAFDGIKSGAGSIVTDYKISASMAQQQQLRSLSSGIAAMSGNSIDYDEMGRVMRHAVTGMGFNVNGRQLAEATASDYARVNNYRNDLIESGVAL